MYSPANFIFIQLITFLNLTFGVLAILSSNMNIAALFVLIAAIFDRFDGKLARKLGIESDFGKQFDSLSDLVSFGVAPAVIAWKICFNFTGILGYIVILLYVMAGAFRLARFNITNMQGSYTGMPITVAGSIVAIFSFFISNNYTLMSIILMVLSLLMVSKISFKKI